MGENAVTWEDLERQLRESASLEDRIADSRLRIGAMCSQGRPPKMSIPVQWRDDDFFINTTLKDCDALRAEVAKEKAACDEFMNINEGLNERITLLLERVCNDRETIAAQDKEIAALKDADSHCLCRADVYQLEQQVAKLTAELRKMIEWAKQNVPTTCTCPDQTTVGLYVVDPSCEWHRVHADELWDIIMEVKL